MQRTWATGVLEEGQKWPSQKGRQRNWQETYSRAILPPILWLKDLIYFNFKLLNHSLIGGIFVRLHVSYIRRSNVTIFTLRPNCRITCDGSNQRHRSLSGSSGWYLRRIFLCHLINILIYLFIQSVFTQFWPSLTATSMAAVQDTIANANNKDSWGDIWGYFGHMVNANESNVSLEWLRYTLN